MARQSAAKAALLHYGQPVSKYEEMDRKLRQSFLTAVATRWKAGESPVPTEEQRTAGEDFIDQHGLEPDQDAASTLRSCTPGEQRVVMMRGGMEEARNPGGLVMARIREVVQHFHTPVKGTRIYVLHMRALREDGTSLEVKQSSFKTLGNFFKCLEADGLVSLQPNESDPLVNKIHMDHPEIVAALTAEPKDCGKETSSSGC